jgi:hypothetical protein
MANVSRINGFTPVKHITGAPYNGQFNFYEIVAGDGTTTHVGDVVKADGGTGTEGYTTCIRFAASGQATSGVPLGVIVGFVVSPTNLNYPQFRAASTKRIAMVCDDPGMIYEVQDGGTVPCTQALIGMNTGITATIGLTTSSNSLMATGTTAPTTTNTLPLRVMGIKRAPDNNDGTQTVAAAQKLLVMFNPHQFQSVGTEGV